MSANPSSVPQAWDDDWEKKADVCPGPLHWIVLVNIRRLTLFLAGPFDYRNYAAGEKGLLQGHESPTKSAAGRIQPPIVGRGVRSTCLKL